MELLRVITAWPIPIAMAICYNPSSPKSLSTNRFVRGLACHRQVRNQQPPQYATVPPLWVVHAALPGPSCPTSDPSHANQLPTAYTLSSQSSDRLRWSGTAFCAVSALAYTGSNICLRQLSVLGCDPMWVICNKELVTVVVVGAWLLREAWHGRRFVPDRTTVCILVAVGLLTQLVGNIGAQWAMGVVGLAVSIPAIYGTGITGVAVLGWAVLGERVSLRFAVAIVVLWLSLGLLGMGAETIGTPTNAVPGALSEPVRMTLGVGAACVAGAVFSLLNVTMCHSVRKTTTPATAAFLITLMGVVSLGPLSLFRLGMQALLDTPAEQFMWMAASGICNLIGFVSLGYGLRRTTMVHANVLNASQVAMAAIAGMLLFHESPNFWIFGGICLTILGTVGAGRPAHDEQVADRHI